MRKRRTGDNPKFGVGTLLHDKYGRRYLFIEDIRVSDTNHLMYMMTILGTDRKIIDFASSVDRDEYGGYVTELRYDQI